MTDRSLRDFVELVEKRAILNTSTTTVKSKGYPEGKDYPQVRFYIRQKERQLLDELVNTIGYGKVYYIKKPNAFELIITRQDLVYNFMLIFKPLLSQEKNKYFASRFAEYTRRVRETDYVYNSYR